jgi:hypothetical protein
MWCCTNADVAVQSRRRSRSSSGMADDSKWVAADLQGTSAIGPNRAGIDSVHRVAPFLTGA